MAATLAQRRPSISTSSFKCRPIAHRMPIENAAVRWPLRLSPYVKAATIHIPMQTVRLAGAARVRQRLALLAVALPSRTSSARQPKSRALADVYRACQPAAADERRAPTTNRPATKSSTERGSTITSSSARAPAAAPSPRASPKRGARVIVLEAGRRSARARRRRSRRGRTQLPAVRLRRAGVSRAGLRERRDQMGFLRFATMPDGDAAAACSIPAPGRWAAARRTTR